MKSKNLRQLIAASLISITGTGFSATSTLTITADGNRWETYWEVNGAQASTVNFNFDGYASNSGADMDSATQAVTLVDTQYSGVDRTVVFTAPQGCDIGGSFSVPANTISIVNTDNGAVVANNGQLTLKAGTAANLALRMAGAGGEAGAVDCSSGAAGELTYTY